MGAEDDYLTKISAANKPTRKPSLQSRLQEGNDFYLAFVFVGVGYF